MEVFQGMMTYPNVAKPVIVEMESYSQMARSVMELMEQINARGTTIIMVTHDPELAMRAQRNVHIIDGRASDLRRGPSLARPETAQA